MARVFVASDSFQGEHHFVWVITDDGQTVAIEVAGGPYLGHVAASVFSVETLINNFPEV